MEISYEYKLEVQMEMFEDFSIFSSGGHFVYLS